MYKNVLPLVILSLMNVVPAIANDLNSEGIKAYRAGDYVRAEQLYRQALADEKDNDKLVAICRNLAVLYQAQGKDASEFNKKADELSKAQRPRIMTNDSSIPDMTKQFIPGGSINNPSFVLPQRLKFSQEAGTSSGAQTTGATTSGQANQPQSPGQSDTRAAQQPQNQSGGSPALGVGFSTRSVMTESSVGANSPFGGFQRDSRTQSGLPGFGYPSGYGTGYSVQTPNGSFGYSDGSPVILNTPDGRPVIIKAPGQNSYATQQNPDGGTTTIINRTY